MSSLEIELGDIREVVSFDNFELSQKLLIMGILPGTRISLIRKSPLGGTYYFKIDENIIALRKSEAKSIIVN
ncbi:MAG: FeoA family protein [Deltaproteobacteria bacterium]